MTYHDTVLTIEEKNPEPLNEEQFAKMIEGLRAFLDEHGFKLESYMTTSQAVRFYGRAYLEHLKSKIDDELKTEEAKR